MMKDEAGKRGMAHHFIKRWKIHQALYAKYGGRVILPEAGLEMVPLDAQRDFLREQEQKGTFQILNKQEEGNFWRYFTDDKMHQFYSKEEGAKFMNTPFWLLESGQEK